jgi:membrane-bound metal-dependent hydrolase YbcI (DUF457 family)
MLFSPAVTVAALVLAVAPDLDIVVWILFQPAGMNPHRGASHSIFVALALASIAWLIVSRGGKKGGAVLPLALGLAALTHPLLDFLMGCGPPVPLLWPFRDHGWLSPVQLIPTAYYSRTLSGLASLALDPRSIQGYILEIMIFTPILAAEKYSAPGERLRWWLPCALFSLFALLAVSWIYN